MGPNSRGFFSIDALFAVTLLLLISASFLNIYGGRKAAAELMDARLKAKIVGEKLAAAINTVYVNGKNFELRLNLPGNIGSYSYRVTFDDLTRQISVENSAWGAVKVGVVYRNVELYLEPENLKNTLRVYWADENFVKVVST